MNIFSPRLSAILRILAEADQPVSVDALAESVGVSRRTVFRDLEGTHGMLRQNGLSLATVPGRGMELSGPAECREELRRQLSSGKAVPRNRKERQMLLALLLMDNDDIQKLYYYADAMSVSEATVSGDLDHLEPQLEQWGLTLTRNRGQGVVLNGTEERIRRAMTAMLLDTDSAGEFSERFGYPPPAVFTEMNRLMDEQWSTPLDWITDGSLKALRMNLIVMMARVQSGRTLPEPEEQITGLPQKLADQICDSAEDLFSVVLPPPERTAVAMFLRTCRAKQKNPLDINDDAAYSYMLRLTFQMIDAFDPELGGVLKLNDDLVDGLSVHLWSAIVRIRQGLPARSLMLDQIRDSYPDLFRKSRRAAMVLEQELDARIPDGEVAFIASHFGAAMLHLGERSARNVILRAGIICVAGIGVSYMMSSQVRQRFRGQLEVVVSDWNSPEEWEQFDLIISSIPLEYEGCPVIRVEHILTEENYEAIRRTIGNLTARAARQPSAAAGALPDRMDTVSRDMTEMAALLRSYSTITVRADTSFEELAKMTGYRFGSTPESGNRIYEALMRREAVSTQVIPALEILLLHARTEGVTAPVVAVLAPETGRFRNEHFQNARGGLLLLAPADCSRGILESFGHISSALMEDSVFLGAVQNGNEELAYIRLEAALKQKLQEDWKQHFNLIT